MLLRLLVIASLCITSICHAGPAPNHTSGNWWAVPYVKAFDQSTLKQKISKVSVSGRHFVNEKGEVIFFRGVNIADPDKLTREGKWNKEHFETAKEWGANIIRIPVHPVSWRGRGARSYVKLLDQAVLWANDLGIYLIIDWHSIGNLQDGIFQHPMYDTSMSETLGFWQIIATRYKNISTIAFYELFNEPTTASGRFGKLTWPQWKAMNLEMIDLIRAHEDNTVVLVAGLDWAYDLKAARRDLIRQANIAYVSHPYPQKEEPEAMEQGWSEHWGYIAKRHPIIATEIGWMHEDEYGAHIPVINNDNTYGPRIINYLDTIGASWVAWVFDPLWTPTMISDWDYTPTTQGKFFKEEMQKKKNK